MKTPFFNANISRRLKIIFFTAILFCTCAYIWARPYTWKNNSDGTWNSNGNWSSDWLGIGATFPQASGDTVNINKDNITITVPVDVSVDSITVNANNVTIAVNDGINFSSDALTVDYGNNLTISTGTGSTVTLNSLTSGRGTTALTGSGNLVLNGTNDLSSVDLSSFTGTIDLSGYTGNVETLTIPASLKTNVTYPATYGNLVVWTGDTDSTFSELTNWSIGGTALTNTATDIDKFLNAAEIFIPSTYTNPPIYTEAESAHPSIVIKKLSIENGATLKASSNNTNIEIVIKNQLTNEGTLIIEGTNAFLKFDNDTTSITWNKNNSGSISNFKTSADAIIIIKDSVEFTGTFEASSKSISFLSNADFSSCTTFTHNNGTIQILNNTASEITFKTGDSMIFNKIVTAGNINIEVHPNGSETNSFTVPNSSSTLAGVSTFSNNNSWTNRITGGIFTINTEFDINNYGTTNSINGTKGTIQIENNTKINATSAQLHVGSNLSVTASGNLEAVNLLVSSLTALPNVKIDVSGKFTANELNLCANNNACWGDLLINASGEVNAKNITYASTNNNYKNITVTNNGTIICNNASSLIKVPNFSGSGSVEFAGGTITIETSSIFETLTLKGNTTFTEANTFNNLTINPTSATEIKFPDAKLQTITSIDTTAATSTNTVTFTSTGTWLAYFTAIPDNSDFSYTTILNSNSVAADSTTDNPLLLYPDEIHATDGGLNTTPSAYTTTNWFAATYYWLGGTNTSWTEGKNWSYDGINPNTSSALYPNYSSGLSEVIITDSSTNELKLTSGITIKILTVETDQVIDFADQNVTIKKEITNKGTIRLEGTQTITVTGATVTNADSSTIEYYGSTLSALPWPSNTYKNLTFTNGASGTITSKLTVAEKTLIINGSGNSLSFNAANSFSDNVILGNSTANAGNITFSGNNTFSKQVQLVKTGNTEIKSIASGFEISAMTTTDTCNSLTVNSPVTLTGNIKTTSTQTYNDTVKISSDLTLTGSLITFEEAVNDSNALSINANVTFNNLVGNTTPLKSLSIIGTTNINTTNITTAQNQTYNGAIILTSSFALKTTLEGAKIEFNEQISDINSPSINSLELTNSSIFTLSENKTLNCKNFIQNGAGKSIISGNITAENISFNKDVYISGSTDSSITGTATLTENLIIAKSSNTKYTINGTTAVKNFVIYSGTAEINSAVTVENDIVVLGASNYSVNDSVTGASNTFKYEQNRYSGNNTGAKNNYSLESQFPDNTQLPAYSGKLTVNAGKILTGKKNFYANGTEINGNLQLPDNTDSSSSFAEAYNSTINNSTVSCTTVGGTTKVACENCTIDSSSKAYWNQEELKIEEAYTVRDNCVYIKFNKTIRNKNGEFIKLLANNNVVSLDGGNYSKAYTDPDCQNELGNSEERSDFYLKSAVNWNTDATGTSSGSANSTDRNGTHWSTIIPLIDIIRSNNSYNWTLTDIYGKRINNYSTKTPTQGTAFTNVEDHTGPVLYSVRIGQEDHESTPASQQHYDAHNFIEFRYSEPVNFGDKSLDTATPANVFNNSVQDSQIWLPASDAANAKNIKVSSNLGIVSDDNAVTNLTFSGLGTIANGQVKTGSQGTSDKYVNALYRPDDYSIRISIAGYTEGETADSAGTKFKIWPGYIEKAEIPSGKIVPTYNSSINQNVTDCATGKLPGGGTGKLYNPQTEYTANKVEPVVNTSANGVYGTWDISSPTFAPYLKSYENWKTKNLTDYEVVGSNGGVGSTLNQIEFHFFDNTPKYDSTDTYWWYSEKGWCPKGLIDLHPGYQTADIYGGSKQFAASPTLGGIRFCTYIDASDSFKYAVGNGTPNQPFSTGKGNVYTGTVSPMFIGSSGASQHSTSDPDGLYFSYAIVNKTLPIETTFTISYTQGGAHGYITDLAGNLLKQSTISSLDRTPPTFDITLSPINQKEIFITIVKQIVTDSGDLKLFQASNGNNNTVVSESFTQIIPDCFEIFKIKPDGLADTSLDIAIDNSIPAKIVADKSNSKFTSFKLTLNRNVTLADLTDCYIRLKMPTAYNPPTGYYDPITDISGSKVTFIQDEKGNYMKLNEAHAISDFAVGVINPLYAYDNTINTESENIMFGLYNAESWSIHNWDRDQQNYGTLPANHDLVIVSQADDGTSAKTNIPQFKIYLSPSPTAASVSSQINSDLGKDFRIWIPSITPQSLNSIAPVTNSNYSIIDGTLISNTDPSKGIKFDLPSSLTSTWKGNSQISYLFSLHDSTGSLITFYPSPYLDATGIYKLSTSIKLPLFALRQTSPSDISEIDLWSFRIKDTVLQRGGVTILNNTINVENGEKTVVKVNVPQEGNLKVIVMTLDGNVVKYLAKGNVTQGEHNYTWNGKNQKGNSVARGMYFIRVTGCGLDETRKVMCVK